MGPSCYLVNLISVIYFVSVLLTRVIPPEFITAKNGGITLARLGIATPLQAQDETSKIFGYRRAM